MQSHDQLVNTLIASVVVLAKATLPERDDEALPEAQHLKTDLHGL